MHWSMFQQVVHEIYIQFSPMVIQSVRTTRNPKQEQKQKQNLTGISNGKLTINGRVSLIARLSR